MSGSLSHPPQQIIGQLLVDLSVGTDSQSADWGVYIGDEPDEPDEAITVYGTANRIEGYAQVNGETQEQHGVQVRIRAGRQSTGWTKGNSVATQLDAVNQNIVTIGATSYNVHSVTRTSGPLHIGNESPQSKREIFTVNAVASIRQIP